MKEWINISKSTDRQKKIDELSKIPLLSNYTETTLEILLNRGIDSVEKVRELLDDDIMSQHNPLLMKDSDKLTQHLKAAIKEKKHVVVYGDYDNDGASATAIAVLALRNLGVKCDYWINNRFVHGYGITPLGVSDLVEKFPTVDVILTVDNGVVGFDGIQNAVERGLQVLVTDHHEPNPDGLLPNADAIVDPKRLDDEYPFSGICGATVIYKMMMCLYMELDKDLQYVYDMVDIVGMATVGDVMPLLNENRLFVKAAINSINQNPRPAFKALKEVCGLTSIDEGTFGFRFVPMINSPGRLTGWIDKAVDLFLETEDEKILELARYLVEQNEERKRITIEQEELAKSIIEQKGVQPVIILHHEDFHLGIVGLVAGRIKEIYNRPTIVLGKSNKGEWKGSGRSIEAYSLISTLHKIKDSLHHYGGHDMACGVGVEEHNLSLFEQLMIDEANATLTKEDFQPKVVIDVTIEPKDATIELYEELQILKPYGTSFESPNIVMENFEVEDVFMMGKDKQHLKLINKKLNIIMWNGSEYYQDINSPQTVKALGNIELNHYNGKTTVQMMVGGDNLRQVN